MLQLQSSVVTASSSVVKVSNSAVTASSSHAKTSSNVVTTSSSAAAAVSMCDLTVHYSLKQSATKIIRRLSVSFKKFCICNASILCRLRSFVYAMLVYFVV